MIQMFQFDLVTVNQSLSHIYHLLLMKGSSQNDLNNVDLQCI